LEENLRVKMLDKEQVEISRKIFQILELSRNFGTRENPVMNLIGAKKE
jgi:hypothetical protein